LWAESQLAPALEKADPTWEQVRIAERAIPTPDEEKLHLLAAENLQAERAETPITHRRKLLRRDHYAIEQRWPDEPFWRRRHAA
jgi:hypothetical protein